VSVIHVDFNESSIFSTDFRNIKKLYIVLRIGPVGAELFREDRRTDITKGIVTPRNLENSPKDVSF
jgi:hypothetical protein